MDNTTKTEYFEKRTLNVQKVEKAISLLEKQIKNCIIKKEETSNIKIKEQIEDEIEAYTNLLAGAVIVWSESLIKALLYEHGAFKEEQINAFLRNRGFSLEQKWTRALCCSFYKAFSPQNSISTIEIPSKTDVLAIKNLSEHDKKSFLTLYSLIEKHLVPAIKIRNKIQHGDWLFAFEEPKFDEIRDSDCKCKIVSSTLKTESVLDLSLSQKLEAENLLSLRLKRNIFRQVYNLIKELAVFKRYGQYRVDSFSTPFQNDFDKKYKQINSNHRLLEKCDFEKYRHDLVSSKKRGIEWRSRNADSLIHKKTITLWMNFQHYLKTYFRR